MADITNVKLGFGLGERLENIFDAVGPVIDDYPLHQLLRIRLRLVAGDGRRQKEPTVVRRHHNADKWEFRHCLYINL